MIRTSDEYKTDGVEWMLQLGKSTSEMSQFWQESNMQHKQLLETDKCYRNDIRWMQ